MGKKVTGLIMGIIFGLALIGMGYFYLVLSIAFSLAKVPLIDIFSILTFVLYPLGILSIIGASLIFKNPKISIVMLLISLIFFISISIYFVILSSLSILYILLLLAVIILGIVSIILSFSVKKDDVKKNIVLNENINLY